MRGEFQIDECTTLGERLHDFARPGGLSTGAAAPFRQSRA